MLKQIKAFDIAAGSSLGLRNDQQICIEILTYLESFVDGLHGIYPDMSKYWKELAIDFSADSDSEADIEWYTEVLVGYIDELLPECTSLSWHDGELLVDPCVENAIELYETFSEVLFDDEHQIDINPELLAYIVVVNDHGNTTLYRWEATLTQPPEWVAVWEKM